MIAANPTHGVVFATLMGAICAALGHSRRPIVPPATLAASLIPTPWSAKTFRGLADVKMATSSRMGPQMIRLAAIHYVNV